MPVILFYNNYRKTYLEAPRSFSTVNKYAKHNINKALFYKYYIIIAWYTLFVNIYKFNSGFGGNNVIARYLPPIYIYYAFRII